VIISLEKRDEIIVWPVYFDSTMTRAQGRKVPKKLAIPSPNIITIEKALKNLNYSCKFKPEAIHPHFPWKKMGMIYVKKTKQKNQIIKEVANEIKRFSV
jgi:signal recognition particle subunit SRP19